MTTRCRGFAILLVGLLSTGCQPEATIETYTVDRSTPRRSPFPLDQVDQILVAIVPQSDKAWFFKLVGKKPAIERQRAAFDEFLSTVKVADSPADKPSWKLPTGWTEKGASDMRDATLLVPDSGGELELAVSSLPLTDDWEDFLVPNVNRWLRQLQSESLPRKTILKLAQQVPTATGDATVFRLAGLMAAKPMGGDPHAGLGIAPPPAAESREAPSSASSKGLKYQTPDGWQPGKMSMMRKAAFLLPGGGPNDMVTVTSFPAGGGQMGDVAANVERWAGQVGMERPTGEVLEKLTKPITVGGSEGTYVELSSPADSEQQVSLFVAMLERQGEVWFFKMIGGSELVGSQSEAFREFLASVEFE